MEKIREPFTYTAKLPGKSIRSKLIDTFNVWICVEDENIKTIKGIIETLHDASLMIDDIQDSSTERRGKKCAYNVFGVALTINSANLAYFEALKQIGNLKKDDERIELSQIFADEMINLHEGQGTEIYFRDTGNPPKLEEYFKICAQKTGGLIRLSVRLLLGCKPFAHKIDSETSEMIIELAEDLGKFYQVRDDYLNIFYGDASDLFEGKYTLPTIFEEFKSLKNIKFEDAAEIVKELKDSDTQQFCIRTLSEMATGMENLIFEIEKRTERKNELKEIIYSLLSHE